MLPLQITRNNTTIDSEEATLALETVAEMMAAEALFQNSEMSQSFGRMLADFLPAIMGESPFQRFSNFYSKERCHEEIHGQGTCGKYQYRDMGCIGEYGSL